MILVKVRRSASSTDFFLVLGTGDLLVPRGFFLFLGRSFLGRIM